MKTIRRYKNRKLYDMAGSHYVSSVEIIDMVRQDTPFQVIDYATNADITKKVLLSALSSLDCLTQQEIISIIKRDASVENSLT